VTPFPTPRPEYSAQKQSYADFAVLPLLDVGLEQIRAGMAWHYKEYQHEQTTQDRLVYRDEEDAAKAARRGLWRDAKPVPPWEWRQRKSEASAIPR
jgi:endonuclease YncB( thermonuclease family)